MRCATLGFGVEPRCGSSDFTERHKATAYESEGGLVKQTHLGCRLRELWLRWGVVRGSPDPAPDGPEVLRTEEFLGDLRSSVSSGAGDPRRTIP